jgi:hypothetical protein
MEMRSIRIWRIKAWDILLQVSNRRRVKETLNCKCKVVAQFTIKEKAMLELLELRQGLIIHSHLKVGKVVIIHHI